MAKNPNRIYVQKLHDSCGQIVIKNDLGSRRVMILAEPPRAHPNSEPNLMQANNQILRDHEHL